MEKTHSHQHEKPIRTSIFFLWLGHLVKDGVAFHAFRLEVGVPVQAEPPPGYTWVGRLDDSGRRIFAGKWSGDIKIVEKEAQRLTQYLHREKIPFVFFQELRPSPPSPQDPHEQKDVDLFMPWVSSSAFMRFRINRGIPLN